MKKSVKILLALLAVIFFAQVCFANYTINPEIPNTISPEIPESNPDEIHKADKAVKIIRWTLVIILGILAVVVVIAFILWLP